MATRAFYILLFALSLLATRPTFAQDEPSTTEVAGIQLTLELIDGSRIIGPPVELSDLPLKVDFGEVNISLTLIQQVTFTKDRASIVVKFRNGDQLTGALLLKQIKVKTAFGPATIPIERIGKVTIAAK